MTTETMEKVELTTEELEAMLKERKDKERNDREAKRMAYEKERDQKVIALMREAELLQVKMAEFKQRCHVTMDELKVMLSEYGGIKSSSKGGFKADHSGGDVRIVRRRDTQPSWDERGDKAVTLIREFLQDTVKRSNKKLFEILMGFLEKNKKGDLEYAAVFGLMKHKNKYDDPRWVEGLSLLAESYGNNLRGYGYEFKKKAADGKWETLVMNFSAL